MEGQNTQQSAATGAPEPRVLSTSLSAAMKAGDSGETEKTAGFDDIFAPPETEDTSADSSETTETPGVTDEKPVTQEGQQSSAPPAEDTIKQLAAEFGLNPADPKHKALLEKMAAEQSASGQEQTGTEQNLADDDEYERLASVLFEEDAPPPAPKQEGTAQGQPPAQGTQQPVPVQPGKFGDILDDTATIEEAMDRYRDAWTTDDNDKVDLKKAGEVMNAIWRRQFAGMGLPVIQNAINHIVNQRLNEELGEPIRYFREQHASARRQQMYAGVLEKLQRQNGYQDIGELFKPLSDKTIKVRTHQVADTPMNRTLQAHPWILDINVQDENPEKALKLTHLKRLQAVVRQHKNGKNSMPLPAAKQLVESGAEIERKKQQDAARQRLNAGPGATSAGAGNKSDNDAWFESVLNAKGGRITVKDLLSTR